MNSQRIPAHWQGDTKPFVFRLGDGTRVPVADPDSMMMPPGKGLSIAYGSKGVVTQIDLLHVPAIEDVPPEGHGPMAGTDVVYYDDSH